MSADVIGLHDRNAERAARRELPDIKQAVAILRAHRGTDVRTIAQRAFGDPGSATEAEVTLMLAYVRVMLASKSELESLP